MTDEFDRDDELRALLAAADPAHALAPADPAGLAALLEDTMSHDTQARPEPELESRRTGTHGRNPLTWLVAAAAIVMIAGVGAIGASRLMDDGPVVEAGPSAEQSTTGSTDPTGAAPATQLGAPAPIAAKCAVPTPEMLATMDTAFAGTVTAVDGDTVTLTTTTVYAGDVAEQVQVTAPSVEMAALLDAVSFKVGQDYLVSASEGVVSVCGFSGPASPGLQRLFEQAFAA